jgi:trigger factor
MKIPGFRPGKAPIKEVLKNIDKEYALNHSIKIGARRLYNEILKSDDEIVNDIIADDVKTNIETANSEQLIVNYVFEKCPTIKVNDFKKAKINLKLQDVTEEEIEKELMNLAKNDIMLIEKESGIIDNGDSVIFDYEG